VKEYFIASMQVLYVCASMNHTIQTTCKSLTYLIEQNRDKEVVDQKAFR